MAAKKKQNAKPPDNRAGVQPSVRVFTLWTPALIRQAEIQADSGNLRSAANLCDWIIADERAGGSLRSRVQALLGLDPTFEASVASDKRRSGTAIKALDAKEDWWAAYPESELAQILAWGIVLGVAPARHNPEKRDDHGGRLLPMPESWHPQHIRYDEQRRGWRVKVGQSGLVGISDEEDLVPGDGTWLLHTPYGKNRPWAWGLWRGLAPLVLLKHLAFTDWAIHGEKGALLVGTEEHRPNGGLNNPETAGSTKELRQALAQDLYQRGRDGVAVLPAGFDLKLVEAVANTKNLYEAQIDMANTAITIGIRGGNLTTEVKGDGGTNAATKTQAQVNDGPNLKFDATSITTTIHDQSLVYWAQWNYGDPNLAPWPAYPVEPEADRKAEADTEEVAFANVETAENLGFDVDRKKFLEKYKIEWAKAGTKPVAPTPPPGTPPAPGTDPAAAPEPDKAPPPPPAKQGAKPATAPVKALGSVLRMLTSGATAQGNRGFLDGQAYAETAHDWIARRGTETLAADLEQLVAVINSASDYDDLKAKLEQYLGEDFDPDELAELTARAEILSELAGQLAVRRDVPELKS